MKSPTKIGNKRVLISEPDQKWEIGIKHDINEGPEVLKHDNNGTPNFGEPVAAGQKLSRPSGACE